MADLANLVAGQPFPWKPGFSASTPKRTPSSIDLTNGVSSLSLSRDRMSTLAQAIGAMEFTPEPPSITPTFSVVSRSCRQGQLSKEGNGPPQGVNRIGPAVVIPAMTASAFDHNLEAAASQGFRRNMSCGGPVQNEIRVDQ